MAERRLDADAWRGWGRDDFPHRSWRVEDGALRAVAGAERVDLASREEFGDFDLRFEWRLAPGGNSGVLYRADERAGAAWRSGPEMQLLDDERHRDGSVPETTAGALYGLLAPDSAKPLRPAGEWNSARIVARGTRVEHWLNGRRILACDLSDPALRARIAASKFRDDPRFAGATRGRLVLQHHGDDVWFRNLVVEPLPAGPGSQP